MTCWGADERGGSTEICSQSTQPFVLPRNTQLHCNPLQVLRYVKPFFPSPWDSMESCLQHWVMTLLTSSTKLTSLDLDCDALVWRPVLGLLPLQHLKINTRSLEACLAILVDLPSCQCLETLEIAALELYSIGRHLKLPDMSLHSISSLKSVEVIGWNPDGAFSLPPECLLRFAIALETDAQWLRWQEKRCPTSMLHLTFNDLQAWPSGIADMSDLRFLELHCSGLQDQDLAALQHIPHVNMNFSSFTTLLLTNGPWQSLQICGSSGFNIVFHNADAFVRGTEHFLFKGPSQGVQQLYRGLRAACARQRVACHECEHTVDRYSASKVARLSNMELCRALEQVVPWRYHEGHKGLIDTYGFWLCKWPSRATFPELYR